MKSTKYITSMGDLKRKDDSLCFRKSGKNIYLPVENIKEIYCLNENKCKKCAYYAYCYI